MTKPTPDDPAALEQSRQLGHEVRDVKAGGVIAAGMGLLGVMIFGLVAAYWLAVAFGEPPRVPGEPEDVVAILEEPDEADLEVLRLEMEAKQKRVLHTYGWVDREDEIARIPIERAIELLPSESKLFGTTEEKANRR